MKACYLTLILASSIALAQKPHDLASEVNPFIGSSGSINVGSADPTPGVDQYGNVVPGAQRPFGMLNWGPDFIDVNSEKKNNFYRYEDTVTRGFSVTHLSGPGCSAFGEVPILPIVGTPTLSPTQVPGPYVGNYRSEDQVAEPGYYAVKLTSGINVELAAGVRSGMGQFTFPVGQEHSILVDLSRNLSKVDDTIAHVDGQTITGVVSAGEMCNKNNHYRLFFVMHVEEKPSGVGTFDELHVAAGSGEIHGPRTGAYFSFPESTKVVHVKVGLSYVSLANAELNLAEESAGLSFEKERREAREAWNEALGKIQVRGGTPAQRHVFYTALYHSLVNPTTFSDVNGDYIGFDTVIHKVTNRIQYANYSGWDIYRCQVQLVAMLFPKIASDMAQSLVVDAEQGGGLPIWSLANDEAGFMVGDPGALILAGIYSFGAKDFDTTSALKSMLRGANDVHAHSRWDLERPYLDTYLARGYVAADYSVYLDGAASITLEYTSADFAISKFAESLGDRDSAKVLLKRSANWRTLFDSETKYIRPRDAKGEFYKNFTPGNGMGFVEGNSGHYTFMIPYDMHGVVQALGGNDAANLRLDDYFSQYGRWRGGPYFLIENEPSFGAPWIYNWTGRPWRAQQVVRKTLKDLFLDTPGGLPGNDDLGATSAWAVYAQLGIYPVITGVGGVTINSPIFPEVTMKLGTHDLHIRAQGAPEKMYIQKATVDGKPVGNWWIPWADLSKADTLDFTLSATPDRAPGQEPPSYAP